MWTNGTRRHFLQTTGLGIGWLAALDLFGAQDKKPPLPATAKSVIHLFMQGGPSHVDTFDPKPLLTKLDGQHPPESLGTPTSWMGNCKLPFSSAPDGRSSGAVNLDSKCRICFPMLLSEPTTSP